MAASTKLSDVFGIVRGVPLTYQPRRDVDVKFQRSLSRDKHIVIFGGSKQGKTCLRKKCLGDNDHIVVQATSGSETQDIYQSLFKQAGARTSVTDQVTTKGEVKLAVDFKGKAGIPLLAEAKAGGSVEGSGSRENTLQHASFEIDPSDPNDVIHVLKQINFRKYVVIEDFHYLSEDVQRQVAFDLKAFHEKSNLCFIIVGVWLESDRLVLYNGDLAGRIVPVDADKWTPDELRGVIEMGEQFLRIQFTPETRVQIVESCKSNVGILQDTCYRLCEKHDIFSRQDSLVTIGNPGEVLEVVRDIIREQAGRYQNFISQIVQGFQASELEMYRWIMMCIIHQNTDDLKKGFKAVSIHRSLQTSHPQKERLLFFNVTQALKRLSALQGKLRVKPVILNYSPTEAELRVTDSGFLLYLDTTEEDELTRIVRESRRPKQLPIPTVEAHNTQS